ncbi:MAG: hypothetical protein WC890_05720 [Candidatus Margulisiibacteriota bacterium]
MKFNFRMAMAILVLFVFLAVVHLFFYTQNIRLKYTLTDNKIKITELRSKNCAVGSQVSRGETLGSIEKIAKGSLGMVYPDKINYIVPGKTNSVIGSAEANPPKP